MALSRKAYRFLPDNTSVNPEPMFEFDEGDIWNNSNGGNNVSDFKKSIPISRKKSLKKIDHSGGELARSLPLNIPDWSKMMKKDQYEDDEDDDDESGHGGNGGKVPPHEYLLARQLRKTQIACSFSVHEGRGRTLKGRDLSRVRNAIWEQTGFQD
ncbi:hypothetical protein ACHQM5_027314 [Ranunculus cassubicifolius]